jgi:cyanate permease
MVGPVFDIFQSWALALGVLALPASIALFITLKNREMLHECYDSEMQRRLGAD